MNKKQTAATILVLLAGAIIAGFVLRHPGPAVQQAEQNHHDEAGTEPVKGPHRGRLLTSNDFAAEITIFESGVPPEFRVYVYQNNKPIDPSDVKLTVTLHRFGGRVDTINFSKRDDYLLGDQEIVEPHSFDVTVLAEYAGKSHRWEYQSYEGRTTLTPDAIKDSGLVISTAGPARIKTTIPVTGRIVPNEDRLAHVIPRYPGIARKIGKRLGDAVSQDETIAIVEGNESLQSYEVKSSMTGIVIKKNVTQGEFVGENEPIYIVADLSTVWVDLDIHQNDFPRLKIGQAVNILQREGIPSAQTTISYISPIGAADTQTTLARVELPNPDALWRPGFFITAEITVEEATVPLAVKTSALQTFRDWNVVFMQDGNVFEIAILELGRRDAEWVEVLSGLNPGQSYVSEKSFIIKADILKSGASHDH